MKIFLNYYYPVIQHRKKCQPSTLQSPVLHIPSSSLSTFIHPFLREDFPQLFPFFLCLSPISLAIVADALFCETLGEIVSPYLKHLQHCYYNLSFLSHLEGKGDSLE